MAASTLQRDLALPPEGLQRDLRHAAAQLFAKAAMAIGAWMCLLGAVLLLFRSLA
jgi:hypothetical protein